MTIMNITIVMIIDCYDNHVIMIMAEMNFTVVLQSAFFF
jgi:hypothetical protein